MNRFIATVLVIAGVIHATPGIGVIGGSTLAVLYGVSIVDPTIELLLRHRAVLFGMLGLGFIVAAVRREWHVVGLAVAIVSTVTFVALAIATTGLTSQVDRVVLVDVVLLPLLLAAAVWRFLGSRKGGGGSA